MMFHESYGQGNQLRIEWNQDFMGRLQSPPARIKFLRATMKTGLSIVGQATSHNELNQQWR
jgi:hypothetical protein